MEKLSIRSFLSHGHEYDLYVYNHVDGVPSGVNIYDANEIVPSHKICKTSGAYSEAKESYAGFSDYFRYNLLEKKGGWWIDTDFVCLRPLVCDSPYFFVGDHQGVSPGIVKMPRGPLADWIVLESDIRFGPNMGWAGISGLMADGVKYFGLHEYVVPVDKFFLLTRLDLLAPTLNGPETAIVENSTAVHMWNEEWRSFDVDKDANYSSTCLYETWMRRFGVKP
jgi:hypothetical protein